MSNLDAQLREELRPELRRLLCGGDPPVLYVTHDQQEAIGMADRLAVLDGGRLLQLGTPRQLYEQPAHRFVATFLGRPAINLLPASNGRQLALRPEHLHPVAEGGLAARLVRREWWGHQQLLFLESERGNLRMLLAAETSWPDSGWLGWQRRHELWFDAVSGERIHPEGSTPPD
jgi:multiple sugar transport system ATP-binding protein